MCDQSKHGQTLAIGMEVCPGLQLFLEGQGEACLQRLQRGFYHARQEDAELVSLCAWKVVVARVLDQASEEERPGQVVHSVLLGAHRSRHNLCIQVVCQLQQDMTQPLASKTQRQWVEKQH